jgi:hypothetical protein
MLPPAHQRFQTTTQICSACFFNYEVPATQLTTQRQWWLFGLLESLAMPDSFFAPNCL